VRLIAFFKDHLQVGTFSNVELSKAVMRSHDSPHQWKFELAAEYGECGERVVGTTEKPESSGSELGTPTENNWSSPLRRRAFVELWCYGIFFASISMSRL